MDKLTEADFEPVIGLEIHMQLQTETKAYSADAYDYGAEPNVNVSPITLGHPGTLPVANEEVVQIAMALGLACHSEIERENQYSRKNYFYADLPKGYQITQQTTPICRGGYVFIDLHQEEKQIELTRIHWEEDAGKSLHDQDLYDSLVDLNRCGVPLLELVTEPVIRSAEEAYAFLTEVRRLVRHLGICDGNMEEGSLRCDVNISVRRKGTEKFGTKVEVKNMNSFRNVTKAIEHEFQRQVAEVIAGNEILSETRTYDAGKNTTTAMRSKELANDYRYFPEPDLPPVLVTEQMLAIAKAKMPELPREMIQKYIHGYHLSDYDAQILADNREQAAFFEQIIAAGAKPKLAANWMLGPVRSHLNATASHIESYPLPANTIAKALQLVDEDKLSFSGLLQKLLPELVQNPLADPETLAKGMDMLQDTNADDTNGLIAEILAQNPAKVAEYKAGKRGIVGMFMGQLMKATNGKLNPKQASELLTKALDES